MQRRRDEYANRCEFHLRWQMPKIGLTRQNAVNVTVDRAGRVVAVDRAARTPVERRLEEALLATPPCQAVPAELGDEAGRLKFGPLAFRKDD